GGGRRRRGCPPRHRGAPSRSRSTPWRGRRGARAASDRLRTAPRGASRFGALARATTRVAPFFLMAHASFASNPSRVDRRRERCAPVPAPFGGYRGREASPPSAASGSVTSMVLRGTLPCRREEVLCPRSAPLRLSR